MFKTYKNKSSNRNINGNVKNIDFDFFKKDCNKEKFLNDELFSSIPGLYDKQRNRISLGAGAFRYKMKQNYS